MRFVNRTAVVIVPGQRYLDWLHEADPTSARISLLQVQSEPSVYLLPECDNDRQAMASLRRACKEIFIHELDSWYRDTETWPKQMGFQEFKRWFDYSFHSVVIDLCP